MLKKIITEFVGTFIFLSVILATGDPFAIGLSLAVAIYFGIKVSGGHFNPAVSIMMYFKKAINDKELACYIISQVLGGIVALNFFKMKN
jgi:aquaporin Z